MDDQREQDIQQLESAANFMRGMALDPRIPQYAREALISKMQEIDAYTEAAIEQEQPK